MNKVWKASFQEHGTGKGEGFMLTFSDPWAYATDIWG